MKAVPPVDAAHRQARRAAVIVEDPLLVVIEGEDAADPGAIADALELIVKWAVREHLRRDLATDEAAVAPEFTAIGAGEQA
jgi:hypothetical protein